MKTLLYKLVFLMIVSLLFIQCKEDEGIIQPQAIQNLIASPGIEQITLKWDASSASDFNSYWISYMPGDGLEIIESQNTDSVVFNQLNPGTDYTFTAVWVNSGNVRSHAAVLKATPEALFVEPEVILEGDLLIESQDQLDDLPLKYTKIDGKLRIKGTGITNLSNLSDLKEVGANLEIIDGNDGLNNLEGLENLKTIGGNCWIRNNVDLASLEALGSLTSIGGNLYLYGHTKLESLSGLDNLEVVGDMYIGSRGKDSEQGNTILTDFCALSSLLSKASSRTIFIEKNAYNPTVEQIASGECAPVVLDGGLTLTSQAELDALTDLYTHITGKLVIKGADISDLSKFSKLIEVGGLEIRDDNSVLTSLEGLNNLQKIKGNFWLRNNPELTSIEALASLTKISGSLYLYGNVKLTTLNGLDNLAIVTQLFIGDRGKESEIGNTSLTDLCAIKTALSGGTVEEVIIAKNAYNPTVEDILADNCKQ